MCQAPSPHSRVESVFLLFELEAVTGLSNGPKRFRGNVDVPGHPHHTPGSKAFVEDFGGPACSSPLLTFPAVPSCCSLLLFPFLLFLPAVPFRRTLPATLLLAPSS